MTGRREKQAQTKTPHTASEVRRASVFHDRRAILKKVPRLRKIKSGRR
jgi:hypothetical protein